MRLKALDEELDNLRHKQEELNAQWEKERSSMTKLTQIKEELERVNLEVQQARICTLSLNLFPISAACPLHNNVLVLLSFFFVVALTPSSIVSPVTTIDHHMFAYR